MVDKVQHSPIPPGAYSVLASSTFAFMVCFAAWMMFAVLGIPIKAQLGLNETQFGLLTAMPVLTGSLVRVPLGIWTDRFGGRIVLFLLMLSTVPAIWLMAYATEYWQFLLLSLFVGLAGGSFSVDMALYAFIAFYLSCMVVTWWFYARKGARTPC